MIENQALKAEAYRLGFSFCGVTSADPPQNFPRYQEWIASGLHAGMDYLAAPRALACRAEPARLMPGVKSIVVLASPYPKPDEQISSGATIAGYAQSTDYHNVLPPRLEALAGWISRQAGQTVQWRGFTDSAPILEKELGQRAGLGWIGKNGCLINPRWGSFFTLAELFLDISLPPDPPFTADRCGACRRCLDACPTSCILPNRTLDAARCLSYLTIENKAEIPLDLRPLMGGHIFGCDVCQSVCPWNESAVIPPEETLFPPLDGLQPVSLMDELSLDAAAFRERFRHTPVARAKRKGYLRNVAVALGNLANPDAVPALAASLLEDPDPLVRAHAAWALGAINTPLAISALESALPGESDTSVQAEIRQALKNPHLQAQPPQE